MSVPPKVFKGRGNLSRKFKSENDLSQYREEPFTEARQVMESGLSDMNTEDDGNPDMDISPEVSPIPRIVQKTLTNPHVQLTPTHSPNCLKASHGDRKNVRAKKQLEFPDENIADLFTSLKVSSSLEKEEPEQKLGIKRRFLCKDEASAEKENSRKKLKIN